MAEATLSLEKTDLLTEQTKKKIRLWIAVLLGVLTFVIYGIGTAPEVLRVFIPKSVELSWWPWLSENGEVSRDDVFTTVQFANAFYDVLIFGIPLLTVTFLGIGPGYFCPLIMIFMRGYFIGHGGADYIGGELEGLVLTIIPTLVAGGISQFTVQKNFSENTSKKYIFLGVSLLAGILAYCLFRFVVFGTDFELGAIYL